jgi:hypothetical protein
MNSSGEIVMSFSKNPLGSALLAGGVVLIMTSAAWAQNRPVNPSTAPQAPPQTTAGGGPVAPPGGGYVPPPAYPPPYAGYPYQIMSPAGSYLTGASNVINAQGQFLTSKRESEVIKEQAEQAKLDTKRKAIEQWQYEQALQPTLSEIQVKAQQEGYQQMRGNPPDARIWSGEAPNTLLRHIQQTQSYLSGNPSIPLDPRTVSKIRFTDGTNRGDVTLFSQGPKIDWPFPLRGPEFKQNREKIQSLSADVVRQAQGGDVDYGTIKAIQGTTVVMLDDLKDHIEDFTPSDYMKAKRFLNDLNKGARGLGEPNATAALSNKSKPRVSTVDQLVTMMTKQGLRFAPAKDGDETAYSALYQSLRAFDSGASQMVAETRPRRGERP